MIKEAIKCLKQYEDIENRDCKLNKGHIDKMPITKMELKIRRFING